MTGASGVGKGTLREQWLAGQKVFFSTSWTTREARPNERAGIDYVFVSPEAFAAKIAENGFLEHANFVGNAYGTPIEPIEAALQRGEDVILEIEVAGAMQVKQRMGNEAILIFIMPPSLTELRRRLEGRATETPERIEKRLLQAQTEITQAHAFRYVVVNDDIDRAVKELYIIQQVERAKRLPADQRTEQDLAAIKNSQQLRSEKLDADALAKVVAS